LVTEISLGNCGIEKHTSFSFLPFSFSFFKSSNMEKSKQDYISVPTAEPPVYQEEEEVEIQQPKKGNMHTIINDTNSLIKIKAVVSSSF
jgi:hypothetical protein